MPTSHTGTATATDAHGPGRIAPAGHPRPRDVPADVADAYRRQGGLLTGDAVSVLMRGLVDQPTSMLARWIVERDIVNFDLDGAIVVPMFQFEMSGFALRSTVRLVLLELRDAFDDGELAGWFVLPNAWLAGASPLERIRADPDAVYQAARADRFVLLCN